MNQRKFSSYLPIIYIILLLMSVFLMHLSEQVSKHYHQKEIKKLDLASKKKIPQSQNRQRVKKKKVEIPKNDSLVQNIEVEKVNNDTLKKEPVKQNAEVFFASLIDDYNSRVNRDEMITSSRTDIVIRYYKKNRDKDRVYALRNLGYYIHERPAEDEFDDYASNAIFYGDSVKGDDLFMIAYALLESGIQLQSMTLSKYHDAWKAHSVEIGTDTTALNKKPLTLNSLRKKWEDF